MSDDSGVTEIVLGILMTLAGLGSLLTPGFAVICCGFLVAGPILFVIGLAKAVRGPSRPAYRPEFVYPPPYAPPPCAGPQAPPAAPPPAGAAPPAPEVASKTCPSCGRSVPGNARFCPGCGTTFG